MPSSVLARCPNHLSFASSIYEGQTTQEYFGGVGFWGASWTQAISKCKILRRGTRNQRQIPRTSSRAMHERFHTFLSGKRWDKSQGKPARTVSTSDINGSCLSRPAAVDRCVVQSGPPLARQAQPQERPRLWTRWRRGPLLRART